jgi:hypothetical protein
MDQALIISKHAPFNGSESQTLIKSMSACIASEWIDENGSYREHGETPSKSKMHHGRTIATAEVSLFADPNINSPKIGLYLTPVMRLLARWIDDLNHADATAFRFRN